MNINYYQSKGGGGGGGGVSSMEGTTLSHQLGPNHGLSGVEHTVKLLFVFKFGISVLTCIIAK